MKITDPKGTFICLLQFGTISLRLVSQFSDAMDGWIYSVFDVGQREFVVPESPVSDSESAKRAAEAVVRRYFAMTTPQFDWRTQGAQSLEVRPMI